MIYKNLHFSESNHRLVPNSDYCYLAWNLPAVKTCPYATELCKKRCFARKAERMYPQVTPCRECNLAETKKPTFVADAIAAIKAYAAKDKCQGKLLTVRIHTSGDFYSEAYLRKWIAIANHFKNNTKIQFQAYTKSVSYFKHHYLRYKNLDNINIHIVYSAWDDTRQEDLSFARALKLPIFYATTKEKATEVAKSGVYRCPQSNDGSCKECYKNNHKLIVVSYH